MPLNPFKHSVIVLRTNDYKASICAAVCKLPGTRAVKNRVRGNKFNYSIDFNFISNQFKNYLSYILVVDETINRVIIKQIGDAICRFLAHDTRYKIQEILFHVG